MENAIRTYAYDRSICMRKQTLCINLKTTKEQLSLLSTAEAKRRGFAAHQEQRHRCETRFLSFKEPFSLYYINTHTRTLILLANSTIKVYCIVYIIQSITKYSSFYRFGCSTLGCQFLEYFVCVSQIFVTREIVLPTFSCTHTQTHTQLCVFTTICIIIYFLILKLTYFFCLLVALFNVALPFLLHFFHPFS